MNHTIRLKTVETSLKTIIKVDRVRGTTYPIRTFSTAGKRIWVSPEARRTRHVIRSCCRYMESGGTIKATSSYNDGMVESDFTIQLAIVKPHHVNSALSPCLPLHRLETTSSLTAHLCDNLRYPGCTDWNAISPRRNSILVLLTTRGSFAVLRISCAEVSRVPALKQLSSHWGELTGPL